jgi:hypothetical protein
MKRKLVISVAGALFLSSVLAWFSRRSAASPEQEFSSSDFWRISEVTRQRMWGTALPDFSLHTIKALPHWFRRLGTSRIRQIDVLHAGNVQVQVQSSSGLYFYLLEKYEKSGRFDWRVVKEGIRPLGGRVINLNGGGPGYRELRVDGGFALIGGRISSEAVDWLPPLARRGAVSSGEGALLQSELSASVSNEVNLSYKTHPFDPDYSPFANKLTQGSGFSEGQFSTWVSNRNGLKLDR